MIMPTENQIYTGDILCEFNIVVFHHVGQCDDHVALVGLPQLANHVLSEL